jgi:gliding motility-associated-like protein
VVALPSDTTLNLGHTVDILTITAPAGRPVAFEWIPSQGLSCNTCPEPTATAIETQSYVVKITDSTGCVAYDTVLVRVVKDRPVYFPNIFAPDRNYPNDHFTGFGDVGADKITLLRIYDRWGSLIFETHDIKLNEPNFGWDGTYKGQKVDGVFTWYALVHFVDNEQRDYKGSVTVFR